MEHEKLYTLKEAAERLRVSTKTLQREIGAGKIKTTRVGKKYLIAHGDLEGYLHHLPGLRERIRNFTQIHRQEMVNLLQKLVSISSESETDGEERLAVFLKHKLEELGIRSVIHGQKESVTVQGSFGYADRGFLLDCPLDTTPPGDLKKWTYPPFDGVIHGGKMFGRGTADSKGGMVAMIYAVLALKELIDEHKVRVELVFDGGEQNGAYYGMKETLEKGIHAQAGMIGYAGTFEEIGIGARGYHRYTFNVRGRSAHTGSRYHGGVNAISNMAKFIREMERIQFPRSQNKYFDFGSKLSFAQIQGGRAINMVPDLCTARLDVRTLPELHKRDVDRMLKDVVDRLEKEDKNFEIDHTYDVGQEGYVLQETDLPIQALSESITECLGKRPAIAVNGPAHIGNLLYEHKIPMVVFGPKGGHVHSYDEYVEIDSLPLTAEIYANTILKFFGA